jgi:hypothetical protein
MLAPQELNARAVRVRQAFDILRTLVTEPQQALVVAYAWATFSNLMVALEEDAGVFPGYFGSGAARLPEINPFDGVEMPPAVSTDAPPASTRFPKDPLNPPAPTPDQPIPTL